MSKSEEIVEEIRMLDNRIATYDEYLYLRNTGKIEITDRLTQIDLPKLEKHTLEIYRETLLFHWSLEYKKEKEALNEQ